MHAGCSCPLCIGEAAAILFNIQLTDRMVLLYIIKKYN
jgi:hypothetical protein